MMPFSVFRIWGTGLLSWAILAAGIYCIYEWADGIDPVVATRDSADGRTVDTVAVEQPADNLLETRQSTQLPNQRVIAPDTERDRQGGWPYLTAGLLLIGTSTFGWLPVTLLLGRPGTSTPRAALHASDQPAEQHVLDQPDGTSIHVQIHGPKHGPTLVLTHGWSLDRTAWGYNVRDLAKHYRLVLWDLPGLGKSKGPKNGDYSIEKMARDLDAVIRVAGKGPIVLVSHSIGGMITQTFCRLFPKQLGPRVGGIVFVHTTYTNPLRTAFLAPLWSAIEKPLIVPLNHLTVWLAPLAWLSNWQSYLNGSLQIVTRFASFAGHQTWGDVHYGSWLAAKSWPGVVARGNLAMLEFDEQRTLPAVDIPVLVIAAKHDRMTKASASERIEQLLPSGRYASVPAGHLGFWERNSEASTLISEFVEQFEERAPAAEKAHQLGG